MTSSFLAKNASSNPTNAKKKTESKQKIAQQKHSEQVTGTHLPPDRKLEVFFEGGRRNNE
jgi:hypothetical protein